MLLIYGRVTMKDIRSFLPKVNYKISNKRLGEIFQEVDTRDKQELGFDDFASLYYKLMSSDQAVSFPCIFSCKVNKILFQAQVVADIFQLYSTDKIMSLQDFQTFMDKEQQDTMGNDERLVSKFMRDFLNDPTREVQEPFFTNNEVILLHKIF